MARPEKPRVVDVPPKMQKAWGPGRMLIATPRLLDKLVRKVPEGKLTTVSQIMERLAHDHFCDSTCPMTTGIFLRIVAEAAEEDAAAGQKSITPYWRVLKSDGSLNAKYPGGVARQAGYLKSEGHEIDTSRKAPRVKEYEEKVFRL
jgi:alkylated DNA nucleotide flippase Atl1